jgi:DHA2 family multidrug resistance protein
VYTYLASRIDLRWLMMAGLAGFALSMWNFVPITHDWGGAELMIPQAFRGASQQFAVAPTITLTLGSLAQERLKLASGLFNVMRNLGGAIGIAVCATILNDRTNLHFYRMAEHLNSTNEAMNRMLQGLADVAGWATGDGAVSALKQLWLLAYREAQTMAFSDAFLAVMPCFVVATAMVPLMRKVAPPKMPSADAH